MKIAQKLFQAILIIGIVVVALLAFTPAHATCTGGKQGCAASSGANSPVAAASAQSHSRASSRAVSSSVSTATGGTASAQGGTADSTAFGGASTAAGGDASGQQVTFQGDSIPRQTPPAFAGTVQPTASCKGAINAGASTAVAGISFGKDRTDDECDLRETARMFYEMQERELAVELLCKSKAAQRLAQCAPTAQPAPIDLTAVRERRIVEHGGPNFSK